MSAGLTRYEQVCAEAELLRLLQEGRDAIKAGRFRPAEEVVTDLDGEFGITPEARSEG